MHEFVLPSTKYWHNYLGVSVFYPGLAHLEALEMLSNQCEKKVNILLNALSAEMISTVKPQLLLIKQNFEINDDDDDDDITEQQFDVLVTDLLTHLNIGTTADKLIKVYTFCNCISSL